MKEKTQKTDNERFEREMTEFFEAYPECDLDSIPLTVWENVTQGMSLKEAYDKYASERGEMNELAQRVNESNRSVSSGGIGGGGRTQCFTARQVAAMTDAQVRENYTAIMESMGQEGFFE